MDTFTPSDKQRKRLSNPRRKSKVIGTYEGSLILENINGIFSLSPGGSLHKATVKQLKHIKRRKERIDELLPPLPPRGGPPIALTQHINLTKWRIVPMQNGQTS